jgi:phosphoribosylformimino-5-aminoimidazole carboxamide ribotide isomerase
VKPAFSAASAGQIIGVIDLRNQQAVHAIAGNRQQYQPVAFVDGDAVELTQRYLQLGVGGLYLADLDALMGGQIQADLIARICAAVGGRKVLVDIGWKPSAVDVVSNLARRFPNTLWIAATETCEGVDDLQSLRDLVTPQRTVLSLDYRHGKLIARTAELDDWIHAATPCQGIIVLDLAGVGMNAGPQATEICRHVRAALPEVTLYSGGGIRSTEDLESLLAAGCDQCLIATALHHAFD